MALYSKNQLHRGHPQSANGRLITSVSARKMDASSSALRRPERTDTRKTTPNARIGKNFIQTAMESVATAARSRPAAQSQRPASSGRMPSRSQFSAPYTSSAGEAAQAQGFVAGSAQMNQSVPSAQAARKTNVSAKYPARPGATTLGSHIPSPSSTGYSIGSSM